MQGVPASGHLLHDAGGRQGVGGGGLVGADESGDAQLDAAEIADHDHEDVAQAGRVDLSEDGAPGRAGRLAVVVRPPGLPVQAEPPGVAVMARVVILLLERGDDLLDLGFALDGIGAGDESASVILEKPFARRSDAFICIIQKIMQAVKRWNYERTEKQYFVSEKYC